MTSLAFNFFIILGIGFLAQADTNCRQSVQNSTPLLEAVEQKKWADTEAALVTITEKEISQTRFRTTSPLRPEFEVLVLDSNQKALLALIPKNQTQVVQWQLTSIPIEDFTHASIKIKKSRLIFKVKKQKWWQKETTDFKSQIIITPQLQLEAVTHKSLVDYVKAHPRLQDPNQGSSQWSWLKTLFGKSWTQIFSSKGKLNSLETSTALLEERKLIVPGKEKFLHVNGEVFTSQMTITGTSPFTGSLAPGTYQILGRFSASMKDLKLNSTDNQPETNSLAISLLIFKTQNEKEVPGVLFLQDSLPNIINTGLQNYALTNNPNFAFKPKSLMEFVEQSFAIFGVAFSSFKNSRDSGRGVQGNFRSTLGAAGTNLSPENGDRILGPKFIAIQSTTKLDPNLNPQTHTDILKQNPNHSFQLVHSNDGKNWEVLGSLHGFDWLNVDSHELTFPHSLSGTIDPNTLRAAGGQAKSTGLILPIAIESTQNSDTQLP